MNKDPVYDLTVLIPLFERVGEICSIVVKRSLLSAPLFLSRPEPSIEDFHKTRSEQKNGIFKRNWNREQMPYDFNYKS